MEGAMLAYPAKLGRVDTDLRAAKRYRPKVSARNNGVFLTKPQHDIVNATYSCSTLHDGIEDRLHVRGRAADDAQHLGCCRLMLQRLAQLGIPLLQLFEQPHVFDRDDCLVGKRFYECDLVSRERFYLAPPHAKPTNRVSIFHEWNS